MVIHMLSGYNFYQMIGFFYFYCIVGWCVETTYVSMRRRKFINRGFLRGPFVPIYSFGAFLIIFITEPVSFSLPLVFLVGMIGASLIELITGILMESIFKVRYWDYSNNRFNFMGHICLFTSLAWGVLSVVLMGFLHQFAQKIMNAFSLDTIRIGVEIISVLFLVDFVLSVKAALDLAVILQKMEHGKEEAKHELMRLKKRMDVYAAITSDMKEDLIEEFEERISSRAKRFRLKTHGFQDYYKRAMIKGNPTMLSKHFKGAIEEIREYLNTRER